MITDSLALKGRSIKPFDKLRASGIFLISAGCWVISFVSKCMKVFAFLIRLTCNFSNNLFPLALSLSKGLIERIKSFYSGDI